MEGSHLREEKRLRSKAAALRRRVSGTVRKPAWLPKAKHQAHVAVGRNCLGSSNIRLQPSTPPLLNATVSSQRHSNMPHFPSVSQATDGQESDVARSVRIRVKTRRRRYLEQNGDYFDSPSLELAGAAARRVYD